MSHDLEPLNWLAQWRVSLNQGIDRHHAPCQALYVRVQWPKLPWRSDCAATRTLNTSISAAFLRYNVQRQDAHPCAVARRSHDHDGDVAVLIHHDFLSHRSFIIIPSTHIFSSIHRNQFTLYQSPNKHHLHFHHLHPQSCLPAITTETTTPPSRPTLSRFVNSQEPLI